MPIINIDTQKQTHPPAMPIDKIMSPSIQLLLVLLETNLLVGGTKANKNFQKKDI